MDECLTRRQSIFHHFSKDIVLRLYAKLSHKQAITYPPLFQGFSPAFMCKKYLNNRYSIFHHISKAVVFLVYAKVPKKEAVDFIPLFLAVL